MSEEEQKPTKTDADLLLCTIYLRFCRNHRAKPQIIRVASDILALLVPTAQRVALTFFGAQVFEDAEMPKGTAECLWKN